MIYKTQKNKNKEENKKFNIPNYTIKKQNTWILQY